MGTLIRRGRIETATWPLLDEAGLRRRAAGDDASATDGVLVRSATWRDQRALCAATGTPVGILVQDTDDLEELAPHLMQATVVAVSFPKFTNGRGYSIARLLRGRYGYTGELRAIGDILRDQIHYLHRVGFDAFELRADQDARAALEALHDFTQSYQACTDQPIPLFRRRVA